MKSYSILNIVMAKVWGGGEQYVYDTAKALVNNGNNVCIAIDEHNNLLKGKYEEIAEVIGCDLYHLAGLMSVFSLVSFIKLHNIEFIQCHSGHGVFLCLLLKFLTGAKLVVFKHNALPSKHDWYHKWQRKHVDAYVCVSQLVYDLQIKGLSKNEQRKFHLVHNGIDVSKFYKTRAEDRAVFCIGYAGRITRDKGLDVLLEAFNRFAQVYPNTKILFAGSDDKNYLDKVLEYIHKNNLNDKIELLGHVNDMDAFYKSLDVFVLPSVVREAFGLVLCEAMYCELPVITTDSGAQGEIISDGVDGYIVKKNSVEALFEAIIRLYINHEERRKLGRNAKKKIENNFTMKQYLIKINNLYDSLI